MSKLNNQKSLLESKLTTISDELAEKKRYAESLKQEMQSRTALRGQLAVACLIYYMYSINRTALYKSFSIAL